MPRLNPLILDIALCVAIGVGLAYVLLEWCMAPW